MKMLTTLCFFLLTSCSIYYSSMESDFREWQKDHYNETYQYYLHEGYSPDSATTLTSEHLSRDIRKLYEQGRLNSFTRAYTKSKK